MHFVGLDLAWGEKNRSGIAVIDADGRLLHVGTAHDNADIEAVLAPYVADECLVAIDAPLIVTTPDSYRPAETAYNRDFQRFHAGAYPANTSNPRFNPPRAAVLAAALGLDTNPASTSSRRAIEVYPHPATVVLFGLKRILKYKKGPVADRRRALLELMTFVEGLDGASPRLRVTRNVGWVELRHRVQAATTAAQLDRDEDPVDAVVCAYIGLYWHRRPQDVTIYGDYDTGYIVTPTLPPHRANVAVSPVRHPDASGR
jgi:predicted RNase H-like nuclease